MRSAVTPDRLAIARGRLAMATRFEFLLVGDDEEHLRAVSEAALDEVSRVERLLSRFDPASEVARINRDGWKGPVRVDRELFAILDDCRSWFEQTVGFFDIGARRGAVSPRLGEIVRLDPEARMVRLLDPNARLDFGGYGKGYALDAAARVLGEFDVDSALLHGGTSSILARGSRADGFPWRIGLRDPFAAEPTMGLAVLDLVDCGLSSSAVFNSGSRRSDLIDPVASRPLDRQAACSVIAPTALEAEVLSTAMLAMGKERSSSFAKSKPTIRVAWIGGDRPEVEWLGAEGVA